MMLHLGLARSLTVCIALLLVLGTVDCIHQALKESSVKRKFLLPSHDLVRTVLQHIVIPPIVWISTILVAAIHAPVLAWFAITAT